MSKRVSHTRVRFVDERWTRRRSKEIEQSNNINLGHCRGERARLLAVAASPCGPRRVIPSGWASGCPHKAASWNELGTHPFLLPPWSTSVLVTSCLGTVAVCPSTRCGLDPGRSTAASVILISHITSSYLQRPMETTFA